MSKIVIEAGQGISLPQNMAAGDHRDALVRRSRGSSHGRFGRPRFVDLFGHAYICGRLQFGMIATEHTPSLGDPFALGFLILPFLPRQPQASYFACFVCVDKCSKLAQAGRANCRIELLVRI
jgi:hypothetical protein